MRIMKKINWLNTLLGVTCASWITNANSEVRISEIMTNNVATVLSETYNYDGYVEFYNDGSSFNLKGWKVTSVKEGKEDWTVTLDSSHNLPKGYSLLFFADKEISSTTASKMKSNYAGSVGGKLSTDEGSSITFEKDGKKIQLEYNQQYPHISYCTDGYMIPTPGAENNKLVTPITNRVAAPTVKTGKPGLYQEEVSVELECQTSGAKIYYTTNGDIPTEKSSVYSGAIKINKPTSLRARAYKDGMLYSEIMTGSYILPDEWHNNCVNNADPLPVVSITANYKDINDEMIGIYVVGKNGKLGCEKVANYNQDWMRSANFEYFLNGECVDNQEVEIGVYGGCTRVHVGKSLKIKANKRSGKNKMNYTSFFPSRPYKKYKSLALRNGGNGYQFTQPRWRDMYIQSLTEGMDIDRQLAQPVAFYLNGEFYGMFFITERTNEDYLYHNYGLDEDEIDMFTMSGSYQLEAGTTDALNKMLNYVKKSYNDADFYDKLDNMIDINEYMNYQIIEQYVGNTDWVTNNLKIWRKRDGGKFRWILFDTDFGLSPRATAVDTNMIDFTARNLKTSSSTAQCIMQAVLKNEDLRWRFLDQYLDCLENQFTDERIETNWDSLWKMSEYEMCATMSHTRFLDCPAEFASYQSDCETMRQFAKDRRPIIVKQLKKEYELGDNQTNVKIRAVFPNNEEPIFNFLINKRELNGIKYDTKRYANSRIKIEPEAPYGYKLSRWEMNNEMIKDANGKKYIEDYFTTTVKSSEVKITMYFEYDPDVTLPEGLYLNEICASNQSTLDENGEASDWIEVYNSSDKDIDIAGLTVENVTKAVQSVIPAGNKQTIIPAHGYKLLWADKHPELGPLHLAFKLSATVPETISVHKYYRDSEVELSNITTTPHNPDESYGRETDGADEIVLFAKCNDLEGNEIVTSTPLSANGSIVCPSTDVEIEKAVSGKTYVIAEGKNIKVQNANGKDVRVYSILGNLVANEKADSNIFNITIPTIGIYLVKVDSQCWKVVVE